MNRVERSLLAAASLLSPAALAADTIALRAGLWELSFTSKLTAEQARRLTPKLPEDLLAQVPAAQRADFKRLYESGELLRTTLNASDTLCITEEDLEQGIQPDTDIDESCTALSVKTHRNSQQVQFACDGPESEDKGTAVLNIAAGNPTTFTGSMTRSLTINGKSLDIKVDLQGKWLDSECGAQAEEEDESRLR